jgi:chromosome segregation ATPase
VDGVAVTEAGGIVRVGNPAGASGILERKEQLRECSAELDEATSSEASATTQRETAQEALAGAERELEQKRTSLRAAEDELRRVHSEVDAKSDQQGRMDRLRDELSRQAEGAKVAQARAVERARDAREDREILLQQEEDLNSERAEVRKLVEVVQEEYEVARAEEARLAVDVARLEGDAMRLTERVDTIVKARTQASERMTSLDVEESGLREERAEALRMRAEGDEATERLFDERTTFEANVRDKGQALREVADALAVAEKRVREARTEERAASDRRHELELERQEVGGRIERICERLEGEWGRPLETLLEEAGPVEGEQEALQDELRELVLALD